MIPRWKFSICALEAAFLSVSVLDVKFAPYKILTIAFNTIKIYMFRRLLGFGQKYKVVQERWADFGARRVEQK